MIVENNFVSQLDTYIMFKIRSRAEEIKNDLIAKNRAPISLAMGAPVDMVPDFVIQELQNILTDPKIHTYSIPKGEKYYLDAIQKRMKDRFGVDIDTKTEVFSLIGSKEGIANMIRGLVNPRYTDEEKDIIWIPDPGYASYGEMIKVSGARAYSIPMTKEDNYMPDLEAVYEKFIAEGNDFSKVKAIIANYPNNPLGVTCTFEYMQSMVDFCKKHDVLLMYDNAYCDIYFDEAHKPHSILECAGAKDVAVEFHSFSKPFAMTGWRLGWVCGNAQAIKAFGKLKSSLDTGIFRAIQYAGAKILTSDEGEEYIRNANAKIKVKLENFIKGLNDLGWKNVEMPKTTFYLWIETPARYATDEEFCADLLEKSGLMIVPGTAFGKFGKGYVRLSIVASESDLAEVIARMKADGHTFEK